MDILSNLDVLYIFAIAIGRIRERARTRARARKLPQSSLPVG